MTAEEHPVSSPQIVVRGDKPLIGIPTVDPDLDSVTYFTDEDSADRSITDAVVEDALSLAGAWSDVSWDEIAKGLDMIRHESEPTPQLEI